MIGPLYSGEFETVQVASLKRNRASCRVVRAGQSASVALKGIERHMLRRVRLEIFLSEIQSQLQSP